MGTFEVDKVTPATDALPTKPLAQALGDALAIGGDPSLPVIDHGPTHALLGAVSIAFAQHRHLVLSPDAIWLTIAQGVAQHVRLNAEALRSRLVRHAGRKVLCLEVDAVPATAEEWAAIVPQVRALLSDQVGDGRVRLLECDFSTSTSDDKLVSQIILLDAYSPFYEFWMSCVCGIPTITVTGTVEDWRRIRERIDVIAELDLAWWTSSLAPILDQFVRAAGGDVDLTFWQRIYNPVDAYGGETITGWITRFYPYLLDAEQVNRKNYMLELPLGEPRDAEGPGLRTDVVAAAVSSARINIVEPNRVSAVALEGSVRVVHQDQEGRLVPMSAWWVKAAHSVIDDVVDRLRAEHAVSPPDVADRRTEVRCGPADLLGFYALTDGATLFDGAWVLRPWREHDLILFPDRWTIVPRVIDLADNLALGFVESGPGASWVLLRTDLIQPPPPWIPGSIDEVTGIPILPDDPLERPRQLETVQQPHELEVVPGTLTQILEAALTSGGALPAAHGHYRPHRPF